jgi:nucleoside-diphosphate-sugar epimerase
MMRVALTGGTGFIGANLARELLRRGHEVHLLNRAKHATWRIEPVRADVMIHTMDVADAARVRDVFRTIRPEVVFQLAQHGGYAWQTDVRTMLSTNYLGFINLLEAAEACGVRTVVNAGTSSEYGFKDRPASEGDRIDPNSDYAVSKAAATLHGRQVALRKGLSVATLRLYSIYGPFEDPMRLLPRLVSLGLDGRLPPLVNPETAHDFVYVDDAVQALADAGEAAHPHRGAIFNVCSGRQCTLRELVAIARKVLNVAAEPEWGTMQSRAWDTDIWVGNPERTARELGWRATTGLSTGISRFAEWLQNEPGMREHYAASRPA